MKEVSEMVFLDFKAGCPRAFRAIFERYHQLILNHAYGFCRNREEAEEITQDTFTQIFIYRDRIEERRGILPFLYTVSKRIAVSHFRRTVIRERALVYIEASPERNSYDTQDWVLAKELHDNLNKVVNELPKQQKKVFVLNKLENLSYQEIAERLAVSKNTVKNHLAVATKAVRIKMQRMMMFFL